MASSTRNGLAAKLPDAIPIPDCDCSGHFLSDALQETGKTPFVDNDDDGFDTNSAFTSVDCLESFNPADYEPHYVDFFLDAGNDVSISEANFGWMQLPLSHDPTNTDSDGSIYDQIRIDSDHETLVQGEETENWESVKPSRDHLQALSSTPS
ncbi:hypothetical protein PTMSG1_09817 [Pyrenophora teres f. maculata]|nr:hypothetical protein PTMSG1_09817 [Pyrenophora teres f. maculata]